MTTTSQALFELDIEFNRASIRLCEINGVSHASVLDVIRVMTEQGDQARMVWKRLKEEHVEIEPCCNQTRFPGVVGGASPVADARTMLKIICCLRGKKAAKFRHSSAQTLLATLNPTCEYIQELIDRNADLANGQPGSSRSFLVDGNKEVTLASRIHNHTYMYVRMRLPQCLLRQNLTNPKQLTLNVLKFGVAFSLQDRNNEYMRDPDNGFMYYSFLCQDRTLAELVESHLKYDFKDLTVLSSREYVDAPRLASRLQMTEYSPDSYDHYTALAERLFVYMVRCVKRNWPSKYQTHFGYKCGLVENCVERTDGMCPGESRLKVELSYPSVEVTHDMAVEMGIVVPVHTVASPAKAASAAAPVAVHSTLPTEVAQYRGRIISRDLRTGVEECFANAEQAAIAAQITSASMRHTLIGQRTQKEGKTWRQEGSPYWIPPVGFQFSSKYEKVRSRQAVKATSAIEVRIYESKTAAATILRIIARTLGDNVNTGQPYLGFIWTEVPIEEYGSWSNEVTKPEDDTKAGAQHVTFVNAEDTGDDGRCNGKIVRRHLVTGNENVYDSITQAAARNRISPHALKNFLDKPRQLRGYAFRLITDARFWAPPSIFRYAPDTFEKKSSGLVISTCETSGERLMYESTHAAASLLSISVWGIQQFIGSESSHNGLRWAKAHASEYEVWMPVSPE